MYTVQEVMESRSVAVFGASRNMLKPGAMLLEVLRGSGFTGKVAGINPQGGEVNGIKLYPTLNDIPFSVDLAAFLIPPAAIPEALEQCARKGVKGVVISSEGFAEAGEEGKRYQEHVRAILRDSGMRGFGPNTLGIVNTETGLTTSYFADDRMLKPGSIGFAAQSGIFVGGLLKYMGSLGLHISRGFGLGNKVDVDECDVLDYLTGDARTRTVGLYLEDVRDGRRFLQAAKRAVEEKPVVLLKGGQSTEGVQAILSHTASMAVDDAVLTGALKQAGVLRMEGVEDLMATLMGFDWMPLPRGNRIAIVTYSGAKAILCVDRAVKVGLTMARFTETTQTKLSNVIATAYKRRNPIDLYPDMMVRGFATTSVEILKALMEDEGVHGIVFIAFAPEGPDPFVPLAQLLDGERTKPVFFSVFSTIEEVEACRNLLLSHRIPTVNFPDLAVQVLANMWGYARKRGLG